MYLLLFGLWLVLNGRVTAEICALGAVISAAVFGFLCRFMDYSLKKEFLVFRLIPLFIQYFWVLVKEIVKANVCVLKIILSPEDWPEPALVYFDTELKTGLAKVMLADSITLTGREPILRPLPGSGAGRGDGVLCVCGASGENGRSD